MKTKVSTVGGDGLANNPFAALNLGELPVAPAQPTKSAAPTVPAKPVKHGKVHLRIEKSGRGGKTVTVLFGDGIEQINTADRQALLRSLKNALGCGGAVGDNATLELQGDERTRASEWLKAAGF